MDPNKSCPKTLNVYYKQDTESSCMYVPQGSLVCGIKKGTTADKLILSKESWTGELRSLVREQNKPWNVSK